MKINSEKLITKRKEEIINACETLYQTKSFKEIILKDIADLTTFKRTSIYNYFQTKEEIFLTLCKREYEKWNDDLNEIIDNNEKLSKDDIAKNLAQTLSKREQLLKLISMNGYDMEANSRIEILTDFKTAYGSSLKTMQRLILKFCPKMNKDDVNVFVYTLFPFIYGVYPYSTVTIKHREAMKNANVDFKYHTIYELTYNGIKRILN